VVPSGKSKLKKPFPKTFKFRSKGSRQIQKSPLADFFTLKTTRVRSVIDLASLCWLGHGIFVCDGTGATLGDHRAPRYSCSNRDYDQTVSVLLPDEISTNGPRTWRMAYPNLLFHQGRCACSDMLSDPPLGVLLKRFVGLAE
jgi:hypothetical protein